MKAQILLATHNPRSDLLRRQLASIVAQTEPDWECLVFDDASEDRVAVADLLIDPRFRLLPARGHLGAYAAFQHLLARAPDSPVFFCDQDDTWCPEKLTRMLSAPGTAAFSAMRVVDDEGQVLRDRYLPRPPPSHALSPTGLLLMNSVSGAALMIRPEVARAALPFPAPNLRGWHDQWLASVAARLGSVEYVDEALVDYTQHATQVIGDGLRKINPSRVKAYGTRIRTAGLSRDLSYRAQWVQVAARRLLEIPGPRDPELESLARGNWGRLLVKGVRSSEVPVPRAILLAAGRASVAWQ